MTVTSACVSICVCITVWERGEMHKTKVMLNFGDSVYFITMLAVSRKSDVWKCNDNMQCKIRGVKPSHPIKFCESRNFP